MGVPAANFSLPAVPAADQADAILTGSFSGTGTSPLWMCFGPFNLVFGGPSGPNGLWTGSVQLERSFDGGATWYVCMIGAGAQAVANVNNQDYSWQIVEYERGVMYRLRCTAFTSGPVNYRFSTSGAASASLGANPGVF